MFQSLSLASVASTHASTRFRSLLSRLQTCEVHSGGHIRIAFGNTVSVVASDRDRFCIASSQRYVYNSDFASVKYSSPPVSEDVSERAGLIAMHRTK